MNAAVAVSPDVVAASADTVRRAPPMIPAAEAPPLIAAAATATGKPNLVEADCIDLMCLEAAPLLGVVVVR